MGQKNKRSHHSQIVQVEQNLWFSIVQENKFRLCKQVYGQPAPHQRGDPIEGDPSAQEGEKHGTEFIGTLHPTKPLGTVANV